MNCHSKKRTAEDINSINVALAVDNQDNRNEATEQHILKTRCANETVSVQFLLESHSKNRRREYLLLILEIAST